MLRRFLPSSRETGVNLQAGPTQGGPPAPGTDAAGVMRRIMPDLYFINTPSSQMERHFGLLRSLQRDGEKSDAISLDFHGTPGSLTQLTICAYDDAEPGLLSKVCGALAAHRVSIHTAFVFTCGSHALDAALGRVVMAEEAPRSIVLDTLFLSEPYAKRERALSAATISRVRLDITRVLRGETDVAALLARTPYTTVQNLEVTVTPDATGQMTLVTLRAPDIPGLLYRLTAALAALELNISVAQINTENGVSNDVFFVTRHGCPLDEAACRDLPVRLTAKLNERAL